MPDPINVTTQVTELLRSGGQALAIGFLCIQGQGTRICSGCTSACDQSVVLIQELAEGLSGPRTCPQHGGPWGSDLTCTTCTDINGNSR